jgi:2',3'-cyclic-nucleotide 2'-phosphodiesterase (5'-nucleotidase family)
MVPMVTERMSTKAASAFIWDPPLPIACRIAEELRPQVDLLIALTHIGLREDRNLAQTACFEIILGGHSHSVLTSPELVGRTWVCQGGSHAKFAGVYAWDGALTGGLVPLNG